MSIKVEMVGRQVWLFVGYDLLMVRALRTVVLY